MHSQRQMSSHEIGPPFSCSGGDKIQRACTDYFIRRTFPDNSARFCLIS
jgi:hypothetical protein